MGINRHWQRLTIWTTRLSSCSTKQPWSETKRRREMVLAGIKVPDTVLVRDAIDLSRSASEPFLFNHVMRSWLFGILLSEGAERAPDAELLAVATILHDLGLTDRYTAENRFEVDGANAARSFLKGRGISTQQMQVVWDAIALHTTRSN